MLKEALELVGKMDRPEELEGQITLEEVLVEKEPTLEEVRQILADKSRLGHTEQIRELLEKHGAKKLSEVDSSKYTALLEDVETLI